MEPSSKSDCPCKRMCAKDRKAQILVAARELVFAEGTSRFTLKRIAEKIGITEAGVYRHFATKEDVILSLLNDMFNPWKEVLEKLVNDNMPEQYKILALGKIHLHFLIEAKVNPILFLSDAIAPDQMKVMAKLIENLTFLSKTINTILQSGVENKIFYSNFDISAIKRCILGTFQGCVIKWTAMNLIADEIIFEELNVSLINLLELLGSDLSELEQYTTAYRRFL